MIAPFQVRTTAALLLTLLLMLPHALVAAPYRETASEEQSGFNLSVAPAYQFDATLNRGGNMNVVRVFVDGAANTRFSDTLSGGLKLAYDYADFHFGSPVAFSGRKPWEKVHTLGVTGSLAYTVVPGWTLLVAPTLQLSREQDAGWGNALSYGGIASLSHRFSQDFTLGVGMAGFSRIEATSAFPFMIITWRITDSLSLANPFRPGPTGPAGLELAYRLGSGWGLGAGGAYRSNRFRLGSASPAADAIGETKAIPAWLRLSWRATGHLTVDGYAGAMLGGQVTIDDRNGNRIVSDRYDPAPFLAVAATTRF